MKVVGLVTMLALWFGGIGAGFVLAGHESPIANFLTATAQPGTTEAAGTVAAGASIVMHMKDFSYVPDKVTAAAGTITFHLQNEGRYTHDFRIDEGAGGKVESGRVGAGFAKDFAVTLEPGTYQFDCSVSNHAKRGMTGTLVVTP
jgi:plastocyanin